MRRLHDPLVRVAAHAVDQGELVLVAAGYLGDVRRGRDALRQRPDRVVVGEIRGDEAMEMLDAIGTGHDGTLTTIHASNPRMALSRMEGLATRSSANTPARVARQMVGQCVDLVIHLSTYRRHDDKVRRMASVATAASMDRGRNRPTASPVRTPMPIRCWASWFAVESSSA